MLSFDCMECTGCTEWISILTNKYGKCESPDSYNLLSTGTITKEQKVKFYEFWRYNIGVS